MRNNIISSLPSFMASMSTFSSSLKEGEVSIILPIFSSSLLMMASLTSSKVKGAILLTIHCGNLHSSSTALIIIIREGVIILSLMGNYNSKQQQLQYHSEYENPVYGKGTLYSSNKLPNCYIIKTLKIMRDQHIFKLYEEIENNQNIYLLSLYGYIVGKSCECDHESLIKKCVLTYWEFLSFTLRDCIEYRRKIAVPFHESEVWHIIKAAIFGYNSFERVNVYYEFQEDHLLINHEGRVRLSWQHVLGKNEHLKYYKMQKEFRRLLQHQRGEQSGETREPMQNTSDVDSYRNLLWIKIVSQQLYYSPEQLRSIASLEFTRKINFSQCNVFSLGMMLLHVCMLANPIDLFYTYFTIDYARINFVMATQLSKGYSHHLLRLIGLMLNENPHERITPHAIRQIYGPLMRGEYQIDMSANRELKKIVRSGQFY